MNPTQKFNHLFRSVGILGCFLVCSTSCSTRHFIYEPKPIDLKVTPCKDTYKVVGSSAFQLPDTFVWGGSPVQIDEKYYLFYSFWESGPDVPSFSQSWVLNSKIGLAISDSPYGSFRSLGTILQGSTSRESDQNWHSQMVHNPFIKKFGEKYFLYFIGSSDPGPQLPNSPGDSLSKRDRVQQNQKIGVLEFDSVKDLLIGRFEENDQPLLTPRTRVKTKNVLFPSPPGTQAKPDNLIVVNPSVVQRPSDGKFLLYFKGNFYDPGWRGVHGVALGDSPTGPFEATDRFVFDVDDGSGSKLSAEDPFVWYHRKQKCYFAVVKDFTGKLTGSVPGLALLTSQDGMDWHRAKPSLFMKKELILEIGDTIKVNRLERPQLLLDENDDPIVLFAACSIDACNQKQDGGTFNVQIPLKKVRYNK